MTPAETILSTLDRHLEELDALSFAPPVHAVYNPLRYAMAPWATYLRRYGAGPRNTLFFGMNPGPWGMAQTGIPFGEINAVRDWLKIEKPVERPQQEHPKRPVEGFSCTRSEVSGRRLWALFAERYSEAPRFFAGHLVLNYCPLVFMAETGRNITPDKLPRAERTPLFEICDRIAAEMIALYRPRHLVGVGAFARARLEAIIKEGLVEAPVPGVVQILHPSPASPAANRGWAAQATAQLYAAGVWTPPEDT